jgi:signal transduction histidine kinase
MASVGQLAAGVAHEINNPIGFVQSNLNVLGQYVEDLAALVAAYEERLAPEQRGAARAALPDVDLRFILDDLPQLLGQSKEGVARVVKIVRDLRDFSYVDRPEWQQVDLHDCLESTLNLVSHELKYKATVERHYGTLPKITCMPFQINQVVMNLLINAVQAIPERGRITIRTAVDSDGVRVDIADDGKGIPADVIGRIFEPFFTTKPIGSGTGLGLSVSYGIVRKHGGTIEVASTEGKGTTFTIRLPVVPPAAEASPGDTPT